jgi:hypothetical protein
MPGHILSGGSTGAILSGWSPASAVGSATDQFHIGTFLWGVVPTLVGATLTAVGLGWWDLSFIDLRYVAPAFVVLVGVVILLSALMRGGRERASSGSSE